MKIVFFFNDTATTEIYTLSLHDALPIYSAPIILDGREQKRLPFVFLLLSIYLGDVILKKSDCHPSSVHVFTLSTDRKSTRLNSSHANISYAVFCLKKKTNFYCTPFLLSE